MFDGFSFDKVLIVVVIAALLLGPDRVPAAARRLAGIVKGLRDLGEGAKARLRDELGDELAESEWRRLDPRQYDPRRIIGDALNDVVRIPPAGGTEPEDRPAHGTDGVRPAKTGK